MSKSTPAPLTIPGLPKKGEAAPVVESIERAPAPAPAPSPGPIAAVPTAAPPPPLPTSSRAKPTIAVTVRLDETRYERLKRFGGQHRITNQDIIVAALDHFLQGRE